MGAESRMLSSTDDTDVRTGWNEFQRSRERRNIAEREHVRLEQIRLRVLEEGQQNARRRATLLNEARRRAEEEESMAMYVAKGVSNGVLYAGRGLLKIAQWGL